MLWIIDGYNFIRQSRRFSALEAQHPESGKQKALDWLAQFVQLTGEKVWVVLDAYSGLQREMQIREQAGLKILSSRGGYTADEEIAALAGEKGASAVIVSSDREVQRAALQAGASMLNSDEFEREVAKIFAKEETTEPSPKRPGKGNALQPPKEKKKALAQLRKYQ